MLVTTVNNIKFTLAKLLHFLLDMKCMEALSTVRFFNLPYLGYKSFHKLINVQLIWHMPNTNYPTEQAVFCVQYSRDAKPFRSTSSIVYNLKYLFKDCLSQHSINTLHHSADK